MRPARQCVLAEPDAPEEARGGIDVKHLAIVRCRVQRQFLPSRAATSSSTSGSAWNILIADLTKLTCFGLPQDAITPRVACATTT